MSIFSFLNKNKSSITMEEDVVCFSDSKRIEAVVRDCEKALSENQNPFILAFFKQTKVQLTEAIGQGSLAGKVRILEPRDLISQLTTGSFGNATMEKGIFILVAEHYPVEDVENRLMEDLKSISRDNIKLRFYNSFNDPLLSAFGSERIKELMLKLGMDENEIISHPFITKAIKTAQEKISKKLVSEITADSGEMWLRLNNI